MIEQQRQKRNQERLLELYPAFHKRLTKVITELEAMDVRPRIQDAYRSPADQMIAYNSGHSQLKFGFHNVTGKNGQKESLAVDMLDDDNPMSLSISYLLKLAWASEKNGLKTGIRFGIKSQVLIDGINAAIAAKNWSANVKVGWDPSHVEPTGISVSEAKAGKRPV